MGTSLEESQHCLIKTTTSTEILLVNKVRALSFKKQVVPLWRPSGLREIFSSVFKNVSTINMPPKISDGWLTAGR